MKITNDSLIMTTEEMLKVVIEKLSIMDRRLSNIEGKLNVIEVKVDNLNRLMQVDEMPESLKHKYDLQPIPHA